MAKKTISQLPVAESMGEHDVLLMETQLATKCITKNSLLQDVNATLEGKADVEHTHTITEITDLENTLEGKADVADLADVAISGLYSDLTGVPTIPESYVLPQASSNTLGGIKVGSGLDIDDSGVLNMTSHNHEISEVTGLQNILNGKASNEYVNSKINFINVKDYNAIGDGIIDDTEAIQNAINYIQLLNNGEFVNGHILYFPKGIYKITNTLIIDIALVGMLSYESATLILDSEEDIPLIKFIGMDWDSIYNNQSLTALSSTRAIQGIWFTSKTRNGTGMIFGKDTNDESGAAQGGIIRDCRISNFKTGIKFVSNSYIISFDHCTIEACDLCVNIPSGYSNYGEKIVFDKCVLCNSKKLVEANGTGLDLFFDKCSFDYSTIFIECFAGEIYCNQCHFEYRHPSIETEYLIYCGKESGSGMGCIVIQNSSFICTQTDPLNYNYIFKCDGGGLWQDRRYWIKVQDCKFIHSKTASDYLCGGNDYGIFIINGTMSNQIPNLPSKTKEINNLNSRLQVYSIDETKAKCEVVTETDKNENERRMLKITKLEYLGLPCNVKLIIPNITTNLLSAIYYKFGGASSTNCWGSAGYEYSAFKGAHDSIEMKVTETEYQRVALGYLFPLDSKNDNFIISLNLNNMEQNDTVNIYVDCFEI